MVCFNRLELTKRMFNSLAEKTPQLHNGTARLIIIDNGSQDSTPQYLAELKSKYSFISDIHFNSENKGIAVGRNQGLRMADQYNDPWLSTVDNDVEFPYGWLGDCISIIKENPDFCIGLNMEGKVYPYIARKDKVFQYKSAGNLGTACTVFSRLLHEQIGFFIMEFGLYGEEDADFFYRARQLGYEMGYLQQMGTHFGEGELDIGEYREFKTKCHNDNYQKFRSICFEYMRRQRPLYIPFE